MVYLTIIRRRIQEFRAIRHPRDQRKKLVASSRRRPLSRGLRRLAGPALLLIGILLGCSIMLRALSPAVPDKLGKADQEPSCSAMSEQLPKCSAPEVILYSCGSGWTYFEKTAKCYKRLKSVSFHEARSRCQQMDSNLTSIHSIAENNFLEDNWIGLYTESFSSYKLKWIDGTPVDYVKYGDVWSPVFSGIGDRGGCYVMSRIGSGGRWALSTCKFQQFAICSKASQHLYNIRHI